MGPVVTGVVTQYTGSLQTDCLTLCGLTSAGLSPGLLYQLAPECGDCQVKRPGFSGLPQLLGCLLLWYTHANVTVKESRMSLNSLPADLAQLSTMHWPAASIRPRRPSL